jgi:integrase
MTVRKENRGGRPRLVIDIPYKTADGRRKRYRRDAQVQTRAAAKAEHARLLRQLGEAGDLLPDAKEPDSSRYTFSDAVAHYRRTHAATHLKASTRRGYDRVIDAELVPRFSKLSLKRVDRQAVSEMDAELAGDGLKPATRANVQVVLRSVLRAAVEGGLLDEMPRLFRLPRPGQSVVQTLHPDEVEAVLKAAHESQRVAFALAAYAGLRAGEVRGLRWSDVDLKRGVLTVRRSVVHGVEGPPKSGNGRVVPIAAPLRPYLKALRKARKSPWSEVALTRYGKPWSDGGLTQAFERARDRAKLSGWTFHSLRHFFITELCRRGAPTMVVKQLAGHSELSTTQRYAHMVASDLGAAIALFGAQPLGRVGE